MILLDTSVLIDYLRSHDAKLLGQMQAHDAVICGVTRAEILHGARTEQHREQLLVVLNTFPQVPFAEPLWDAVGNLLATLRAHGVTVPFADVLLAALSISLGVELWTRDAQFTKIQEHVPALRLFVEPLSTYH